MNLFGCDHGPLIAQLRADLDVERARNAELLQRVLDGKPKGQTMTLAAAPIDSHLDGGWPLPSRAPIEPDELKALIDAKCGGDLRKRAMMLRQLAADRAAKVSEEDIAEAIRSGVQGDGVPA